MDKTQAQATIMVVDDTPANLNLLHEILHDNGYRALAFPSGQLALNAAARNPPDLILLDINMPDMNGFEVCERLKRDAALKEIPVIFISALTETNDKVKAFAVGGVDYVTKPFQFKEVHARVETHLKLVRQKRELQDSYDKLLALESLRDGLVHMIVHDMRSPLQSIKGFLELAQIVPAKAADYMVQAMASTDVLLEAVTSLLDVSKMEAKQMTLELAAVDMRELADKVLHNFDALKKRRTLTLKSSAAMKPLTCDAHLIRRVLQNIIGNALKFTDKETGSITVNIESVAEDKVRVSVADNGPGIPPAYREKVFDKFSQAAAHKQGQVYSTGLGLAFCKLAIETHGGRIGLESEVGKGSTFWFELGRIQ
jgi:signal transduction histidine kinase